MALELRMTTLLFTAGTSGNWKYKRVDGSCLLPSSCTRINHSTYVGSAVFLSHNVIKIHIRRTEDAPMSTCHMHLT